MKKHISLVKGHIQKKYYTESTVRGFTISSDEPENLGGTNRAASPIDLMTVALASCSLMYLLNKLEQNKIEIGTLKIKIKTSMNDDRSFTFIRILYVESVLNEPAKKKLLEYAEYTPVTQALKGQNKIITSIK